MRASRRRKQPPQPRQRWHDPPRPATTPTETFDVVVLALGEDLARVRRLDTGDVVGLRAPDLRAIVPGLRLTVKCDAPRGKTSPRTRLGDILHARLDLDALALPHRPPIECGPWPGDQELDHLPDDIAAELRARPREMFEMWTPDEADEYLLSAAIEHREEELTIAYELLMRLVERTPDNIAAHLHLGNLVFDVVFPVARAHYEIAVQIGDRQLGPDFDGILPWGLHANRPLLRSLQGLGLCQWRGGDFDAAARTFRRMLILCPEDGIGARILLADVRARRLFEDLAGSDDPPF